MQAQGLLPLNNSYFTSLTQAINGCATCAELQALTAQAMASLLASQSANTAQLANLVPMLALLTPPTSPTAVVTWVTNFITSYLTPQLAAYAKYVAKEAQLVTEIALITAAISSKAALLKNCVVSIPS